MKGWILAAAAVGLYALHQDAWFRDVVRPLVFGFLPIGLFYHAVYAVAVACFMGVLVRYAWPTELERDAERGTDEPGPPDR